jgi:hypothetical protein
MELSGELHTLANILPGEPPLLIAWEAGKEYDIH